MPSAVTDLDIQLFFALYDAAGGALTGLALALSAIGSGWVMLGLVPALGLSRLRPYAVSLGGALVASAVAVYALKAAVGRVRPCAALPGVHALCAAPTDPSFPSGHACGSFTLAAFVVVTAAAWDAPRRSRVALSAAVAGTAVGIAWSRVYLGVHFPIDVTAGALLGTGVGGAFGWLHLRQLRAVPAETANHASSVQLAGSQGSDPH